MITGAAWAVPIISFAAAAPAQAASRCGPAQALVAARPAGATYVDTPFLVPAGVTAITYRVVGAAGGGQSTQNSGGAGQVATGTLTVVPGQTLVLRVAAGGTYIGGGVAPSAGGTGYGNGGAGGPSGPQFQFAAGSGGGGSAILVGGAPIVVAGGGGGSGSGISGPGTISSTLTVPNAGGDSGFNAGNAARTWTAPNRTISARGGATGTSTAAGAGGGTGSTTVTPTEAFNGPAAGGQGITTGGAAGGTGGNIAYAAFTTTNPNQNVTGGGTAGGGGGGGYTGGGGGSAYAAKYLNSPTTGYNGLIGVGAGGGGGGSFIASSAVGGVTPVNSTSTLTRGTERNTAANSRVAGRIELSYQVCL